VESFRAADLAMGSAFRQKLSAYQRALELAGPEPERGFQSQFARDCGCDRTYISRIHRVVSDPDLLIAINNFSGVGINTLTALAAADPETKTAALEQLERDGELTVSDIAELSEHEIAQIDRDIQRELESQIERGEREHQKILERIQPADSDISRFTHFLFSAGIQLDTYQQKTGEQLTAEKIASFIVDEASKSAAAYNGDPEIFADSIRDIRQVVDLFGRALELVSDRQPPVLTIIK
jgi:transcriptional regulator with XRE-family HTH domain